MASRAEINALMDLETNPFTHGMQKAVKSANKGSDSITSSFSKIAGALGVSMIASKALELGHEISTLSEIAGTNTEQFQRNAHAAKQHRIEQEKLADIYKDTNDKVGDFLSTGGGPLKDFFEQIAPQVGITAEQFRGLSGPDALQLYYDGLQQANVDQAELTFYMEAIASDATALIPLLRDNGAEFERLGNKAKVMGEETVNALKDARNNLQNAEQTVTIWGGKTIGWLEGITEEATKMALSIGTARNVFADIAIAEADAAHHAQVMARVMEEQRIAAEEAAAVQQEYNQRTREYEEYQKRAAQAVEERAEAERGLQVEFKRALKDYAASEELHALELRANGETEAAEAQEQRVKQIKQAISYSQKYNIEIERAVDLVSRLSAAESAAADAQGDAPSGGSSASTSSRGPASSVRRTGTATERTPDEGIRFQRMGDSDGKEYFQRYYKGNKAGRFSQAQLDAAKNGTVPPADIAGTPTAQSGAGQGAADAANMPADIAAIRQTLANLDAALGDTN